ncbi:hypothetical protein QP572_11780, partial [Brevibacterium sp. UMB10442]|nr:hypothetical protein [Brevibacterium sp. UMB10442]
QQQTITTIIHQMLASTIHKQKQQQEKQHTNACSPTTQQRAHPRTMHPIQRAHNTRTQHTQKNAS